MEAQVAFSKLIQRFPRMRRSEPTRRPDRSRFRVVDELRVELRC
jgi:cytochrome P450